MKKYIVFCTLMGLVFLTNFSFGQDKSACTINVLSYVSKENKKAGDILYKLYVNGTYVTDFKNDELIRLKCYSESILNIKIKWENEESKVSVLPQPGKVFSVLKDASVTNFFKDSYHFQLSTKGENLEKVNSTSTVKEIIENQQSPWGAISKFKFEQGKSDYSLLHFYLGGGLVLSQSVSFYINDVLVTNLKGSELLNLKLYSTGRINITVLFTNFKLSTIVQINEPREIFMTTSMGFTGATINETEQSNFNTVAVKRVGDVDLEEDMNNPWGKLENGKKSGKGQGTCFAISPEGYVITNYHCVENAKEITIKGIDGDFTTKYAASVIASDPSNDLALLKVLNKNVKFDSLPYGVKSSNVNQAEKVYTLGFPAATAMGAEMKITDGIISAKSGVGGDISKFQISAAVNPGNSGGPLIDEQGNLIGVIFAKSTIAESAGYAIKASYLETFLKNVDGFEFPTFVNSMKDKPFTEKVADWKNYIFIVETN
jgi:S1-C subfamily serine protease